MMNRLTVDSPVGNLVLEALDERLTACLFGRASGLQDEASPFLQEVSALLAAYFNGSDCLCDVPLAPHGTDFQQAVWAALSRIPFGQTASYGEIARRIGRPTAYRAVAQACGQNRICLFIPCHRITAAHGLGGFSSGTEIKRKLLELENAACVSGGRDRQIREHFVSGARA